MKKIVVIDDEADILELINDALEAPGRKIYKTTLPAEAIHELEENGADIIISDMNMPGMTGFDVLHICRHRFPDAKFLMLTGRGGVSDAVKAMKDGASDFLTKPIKIQELQNIISNLLGLQDAAREARASGATLPKVSSAMDFAYKQAKAVANSDTTVLIQGPTGAGKEIMADFIQRESPRASLPYVKVNCAGLAESLIESELFGHERGAFTGAVERRNGRFERANKGTLFLDEIAELPLSLQPKLLRVLQSHEIERVGGETPIKVNFRLICATHRDLAAMVKEGKFREDLFYRISVVPIRVPGLRERPEEIMRLANEFLRRAAQVNKAGAHMKISRDAEQLLVGYPWPGNVRELENTINRAAVIASRNILEVTDFWWLLDHGDTSSAPAATVSTPAPASVPASLPRAHSAPPPGEPPLDNPLDQAEKDTIIRILEKEKWNYTRAATALKMSRSTLYAKAGRYGIKRN